MQREVWKFPLPFPSGGNVVSVALPDGAVVLAVQAQAEQPCIYALVDPATAPTPRRFRIAGTGHPLDERVAADGYVGTFQLRGGALVFHVFEVA